MTGPPVAHATDDAPAVTPRPYPRPAGNASRTGFDFDLARPDNPDDDRALRQVLADNPVPGRVWLSFEREPSYFAGCGTLGREWQVVIARQRSVGRIVGLACRATRLVYVNGEARELGYLSQLRVDRPFRGQWLTVRGFHYLRQLHDARPVEGYLAAITEENQQARGLLVDRPRGHFPTFLEVARVETLALLVRRQRARVTGRDGAVRVERGRPEQLPAIVAFLRERGRQRQFFPVYDDEDFAGAGSGAGSGGGVGVEVGVGVGVGENPSTRGFRTEDFLVARSTGPRHEIVGVMGLWDQSAYKQTVVRGYGATLGLFRGVLNLVARAAGMPRAPFPDPGEHVAGAYASFVCVARDDPRIFALLLRHLHALAAQRGYAYLFLGLPAGDPLLPVARRYPHLTYRSRLYLASWGNRTLYDRLDHRRLPYVDLATL